MKLQKHWFINCEIAEEKGFWLTGKDYSDCISQLRDYAKENPKKWIFFSDCGTRPGKPIPVPENLFEVRIADKCPTGMFFYKLFQEGSEGLKEEMTPEIQMKQMSFFATLGSAILNK